MKGWKTILFNGLAVVAPVALQYVAGVHWADYVSPEVAFYIVTIANIGLRAVTSTPIGKKE